MLAALQKEVDTHAGHARKAAVSGWSKHCMLCCFWYMTAVRLRCAFLCCKHCAVFAWLMYCPVFARQASGAALV
jgi:hypothetical protein